MINIFAYVSFLADAYLVSTAPFAVTGANIETCALMIQQRAPFRKDGSMFLRYKPWI